MKRHHYPLFHARPVLANRDLIWYIYLLYILTVSTLLPFTLHTRELQGCLLGILPLGNIPAGAKISGINLVCEAIVSKS